MLITNYFIYEKEVCHSLPTFGEYIQGDSATVCLDIKACKAAQITGISRPHPVRIKEGGNLEERRAQSRYYWC